MTALGIDQHRIDGVGVDLPLPPDADVLGPADAVLGRARLDHHAFHAQLAGGFALAGQVLPIRSAHQW